MQQLYHCQNVSAAALYGFLQLWCLLTWIWLLPQLFKHSGLERQLLGHGLAAANKHNTYQAAINRVNLLQLPVIHVAQWTSQMYCIFWPAQGSTTDMNATPMLMPAQHQPVHAIYVAVHEHIVCAHHLQAFTSGPIKATIDCAELTVDAKDCKGSEEEEEEMYLRFASSASLDMRFTSVFKASIRCELLRCNDSCS